ncbi:MAG: hypothetical protein O3A76_16350, partial [Chloroflexi bacterium]|nr:hypothetical protein [Chloroflexota bacterium]
LSELDGSLTSPTFGAGNVGAAVFSGTTIAQLAAQVAAVGGVAVWVQDVSGQWFQFNTLASGPTALANDAFNTAFAAGFPGPVAVFVVRAPGGPPSAPPPPPPTMPVLPQADGNLTSPTFGPGKVGTAVFSGTTIAQLAAEVTAVGGIAVWVQDVSGRWLQYNTRASGSLAFVNSAFNTAFAAGLPGPVAVLVVR